MGIQEDQGKVEQAEKPWSIEDVPEGRRIVWFLRGSAGVFSAMRASDPGTFKYALIGAAALLGFIGLFIATMVANG